MIPSIFSSSCPTRLCGMDLVSVCPYQYQLPTCLRSVPIVGQGNELYSALDTNGDTARQDTMQAG